ncbi:copper transport protein CTR3 [Echria macrotheca]|uniref:Copper transport protein n=1 Tax=Echria macrotheca TaxID=438768 RepID=A0AAJ0FDZ7_9PEZI|nr:copper transport protein CTR3 [Echria macrotheca]
MDHMNHDHGSTAPNACKISMLWNWYTIDACFLSPTWQITSNGGFAGICIGVMLLVILLEALRRAGKEYDNFVLRDFQSRLSVISTDSTADAPQSVTFRVSPLQQLVRAVIHAATFGVAYFIMLLAMYYNGYILLCIFIGAGLGKFLCDWMSATVVVPVPGAKNRELGGGASTPEEPTACCG